VDDIIVPDAPRFEYKIMEGELIYADEEENNQREGAQGKEKRQDPERESLDRSSIANRFIRRRPKMERPSKFTRACTHKSR
jgi:hypothetical protein